MWHSSLMHFIREVFSGAPSPPRVPIPDRLPAGIIEAKLGLEFGNQMTMGVTRNDRHRLPLGISFVIETDRRGVQLFIARYWRPRREDRAGGRTPNSLLYRMSQTSLSAKDPDQEQGRRV